MTERDAIAALQSGSRFLVLALMVALLAMPSFAQKQKHDQAQRNNRSGYDNSQRATVLHVANVYVTADTNTPPLTEITPGHEIVILGSNGGWINVLANTDSKETNPDDEPEFKDPNANPEPSSGWMLNKGVVSAQTPHGDLLLYGRAAGFESEAAQPNPPAGAAEAAHLLYRRVVDYFPDSPLAPEAAFRAADIRWQLDKADNATLPSAHEMEADLRPQLYEGDLRKVMKMYPGSPQAARAAFDLLDNKLCGDWQGLPNCPEKETGIYMDYARQWPGGPKSAEALYDAAYRQGVLVTMFLVDNDPHDSAEAAKHCQEIADQLEREYPKSDYAARAASVAFRVSQGIPVYGSDRE